MIILDTNVVLEILEKRERLSQTLQAIQRYPEDGAPAVTALTLSDIFYILERHKQELAIAEKLLKSYGVVSVTPVDATWAFAHYERGDFEDALQVAAAIRENAAAFLTLDAGLATKYRKRLNIELIR